MQLCPLDYGFSMIKWYKDYGLDLNQKYYLITLNFSQYMIRSWHHIYIFALSEKYAFYNYWTFWSRYWNLIVDPSLVDSLYGSIHTSPGTLPARNWSGKLNIFPATNHTRTEIILNFCFCLLHIFLKNYFEIYLFIIVCPEPLATLLYVRFNFIFLSISFSSFMYLTILKSTDSIYWLKFSH